MPNLHIAANPAWSRDELILALNLYVQFKGNPPGKGSHGVVELSNFLNKMGSQIANRALDFRNPNGVYMKVMNQAFRSNLHRAGKEGVATGE